jgi:hypothetical protein
MERSDGHRERAAALRLFEGAQGGDPKTKAVLERLSAVYFFRGVMLARGTVGAVPARN